MQQYITELTRRICKARLTNQCGLSASQEADNVHSGFRITTALSFCSNIFRGLRHPQGEQ
jgi:hypothetical protein